MTMNSTPSLKPSDNDELLLAALNAEKARRLIENRLAYYEPYLKQSQFHAAGATQRERLLMAGNQLGKTLAGGFEAAMHATGRYPQWWTGRRFDRPTIGWACGVTGEVVRDTVQRVLVGRQGAIGSGAIPKDAIAEMVCKFAVHAHESARQICRAFLVGKRRPGVPVSARQPNRQGRLSATWLQIRGSISTRSKLRSRFLAQPGDVAQHSADRENASRHYSPV